MKIISLLIFLFLAIPLVAQEKALEMSKPGTDKVRIFKENKRVKVKTTEGGKYIGRFQIVDDKTIEIDGNLIPLNMVSNIKSRSIVAGIAGTLLILVGIITIGYGNILILISHLTFGLTISPSVGAFVGLTGIAITASGIFFNEFAKNYRHKKEWTYRIIENE